MTGDADPATFDILGAWSLRENALWENGVVVEPDNIGKDPRGYIFYMPDRRVSVIIARADRARMSADRYGVSAEERAAAWSSFNAYAGTYTRTGATVVHHIELNSYENDVGADYVRRIEVVDGDLVLSTPPQMVNGRERVFKLRWRRG